MKKKILNLFMVLALCFCSTVVVDGVAAKAAMIPEDAKVENYELGEAYNGTLESDTSYSFNYEWRYYEFYISEKSHVTLNVEASSENIEFNILGNEGVVLANKDIKMKRNANTGAGIGSQYRTLDKGVYYLEIGGRNTDFSFTIQAEKQIKLPKGVVSFLKSSKAGQITVSCEENEDAIGYRIQYSTDYKFKRGIKTAYSPEPTKTITGLKKGIRYYVKVCPYTVYDDGVSVYGQNSKVKSIKTKK